MKYFYYFFSTFSSEDQGAFYSWVIYFTKLLLSAMYQTITSILLFCPGVMPLDDATENIVEGFYFPYKMWVLGGHL